jgi:hypothetical protein
VGPVVGGGWGRSLLPCLREGGWRGWGTHLTPSLFPQFPQGWGGGRGQGWGQGTSLLALLIRPLWMGWGCRWGHCTLPLLTILLLWMGWGCRWGHCTLTLLTILLWVGWGCRWGHGGSLGVPRLHLRTSMAARGRAGRGSHLGSLGLGLSPSSSGTIGTSDTSGITPRALGRLHVPWQARRRAIPWAA